MTIWNLMFVLWGALCLTVCALSLFGCAALREVGVALMATPLPTTGEAPGLPENGTSLAVWLATAAIGTSPLSYLVTRALRRSLGRRRSLRRSASPLSPSLQAALQQTAETLERMRGDSTIEPKSSSDKP